MKTEKRTSAVDSDGTSREPHTATEAAYLRKQADDAREALQACTAETLRDTVHALDPRPLFRERPVLATTITGAAVLGIGAAVFFGVRRRRHREEVEVQYVQPVVIAGEKPKRGGSLTWKVAAPLLKWLQASVVSAIVAKTAQPAAPVAEEEHDVFMGSGV